MLRYIFRRVLQAALVVFIVSVVVFLMLHMVPGSVVTVLAGTDPSPEMVEALTKRFGLDQPLPIQYGRWFLGAIQGDLGTSPISGRPVTELILSRLGFTIMLAGAAIVIASVIGIAVGTVSAIRHNTWVDTTITAVNSLVLSVPNFWFGILFILFFSVSLGWLPSGGFRGFDRAGFGALAYLAVAGQDIALAGEQILQGLYDSFILLAVPLFIVAANIMNAGTISERLLTFCVAAVGRFRGGLGHVNIVASLIFSGMSGSAVADAAGIGKIIIEMMTKTGHYTRGYAAAITAASVGVK